MRGDEAPETKYPTAWAWLLLIAGLEMLSRDHGVVCDDRKAFDNTVQVLRQHGVMKNCDLKEIVQASSKKTFKVDLKLFKSETNSPPSSTLFDVPQIVAHLLSLVLQCHSDSKHYLVIDGLDDILSKREKQYVSLGALLFEAARLNADFKRKSVPLKIIILCRTDLFHKIAGANKNKIKQDRAVELDWYHDPANATGSALVKIANLRAREALRRNEDLFDRFFPQNLTDGANPNGTLRYLLDCTRHTPRDFLQLLKNIQAVAGKFDGKLTKAQVMSGVRSYSVKYFLSEIKDELEGYATSAEAVAILDLFGALRRREFIFNELSNLNERLKLVERQRLEPILAALFECSAVGNIERNRRDDVLYSFKFRNRNARLNTERPILLHRGLWRALDLH